MRLTAIWIQDLSIVKLPALPSKEQDRGPHIRFTSGPPGRIPQLHIELALVVLPRFTRRHLAGEQTRGNDVDPDGHVLERRCQHTTQVGEGCLGRRVDHLPHARPLHHARYGAHVDDLRGAAGAARVSLGE